MEFGNIRFGRVERKTVVIFEVYVPRKPSKGDESTWKFLGNYTAPFRTPVSEFPTYVRAARELELKKAA